MQRTILFIGDSLIEYYDWQRRFPEYTVYNRGRSGETVDELLERLPTELKKARNVDWVCLMIGTNNLAMEDYYFLPAYEEIIDGIQTQLPEAGVAVNGLFPMRLPWLSLDAVTRTNDMLAALAERKGAVFVDGCRLFKGYEDQGFLEDGVHLSEYGYAVWADGLSPLFAADK